MPDLIIPTAVCHTSLEFMGYKYQFVDINGNVYGFQCYRGKPCGPVLKKKPTDDGGRLIVNLRNKFGPKTFTVSRLILSAFVGPCPIGMEACHNDGDYKNNRLDNLRWDTHSRNENDKVRHGTSNRGERNGCAFLTEKQVASIRLLYATGDYSMTELAKIYGITLGTIHPLIHRKTWKYVI